MLEQLQSWWQNLSPEIRAHTINGAWGFGALVGGHLLGVLVGRFLRARRFNSLFRVTGDVAYQPQEDRGFTPTMLAGLLVRLTVWALAAGWLLRQYGRPELGESVTRNIGRVWIVAGGLAAALAVAGMLTRRVMECLEGGALAPANRAAVPPRTLAGAVGAGVYVLVLFLTLLTAADYFDWPQTRTVVADVWQLALRLLSAGAAVLVGYLGGRWAREFATPQSEASELQPGQRTGLGIVVITTALAIALLLFGAGLGVGVAALAVVAAVVFLARGRLSDVIAGLKLRRENVGTAWFEGIPWQVGRIGLLQSDVSRNGASYKVANQVILEASGQMPSTPQTDNHVALTR
ncbi:MAG TPA: hypothetical protein VGZ47_14260 [Gemmataceae bacterium]|jgi:hypothetical protein|nr:hypothetical protein [Gemmataceae bacterium]